MNIYEEIENSFPTLEKLFTKEGLLEFKNDTLDNLGFYHFGLGTWIRNHLLTSKQCVLYNLFVNNGIKNVDDMSFYVIKLFHYYLSKKK